VDAVHLAAVSAAALAGGAINAIAGGGSLITFPALVACGMPAVAASATNTVALCPGYLGAAFAQRRDMVGQGARAMRVLPAASIGGLAGALLLMHTSATAFDVVVPFLLLTAVILIGAQDRIRAFLLGRERKGHSDYLASAAVGIGAVYGGYFGAGLGVIVLAVLAIVVDEPLGRLNAFKQYVSLFVNVAAAIVFVVIAPLDWSVVIAMAATSLIGGVIGGAIASRVSAKALRATVMIVGGAVSVVYFAKLF
jgi:uncharacterized membrane protein YfcA